jgi:hypothetical protein
MPWRFSCHSQDSIFGIHKLPVFHAKLWQWLDFEHLRLLASPCTTRKAIVKNTQILPPKFGRIIQMQILTENISDF